MRERIIRPRDILVEMRYYQVLFPLSLSLEDAYGRQTKRSFQVSAADFAAAQVAAAAFITDYDAVTELALVESRLSESTAYVDTPTAGANRDEGMTISVSLAVGNKKGSVQVPGPIEAIRNPDGTIDLTAAAMVALEANYTSGAITASDGETVDGFIKATLDK
jgi:hypothetical protein